MARAKDWGGAEKEMNLKSLGTSSWRACELIQRDVILKALGIWEDSCFSNQFFLQLFQFLKLKELRSGHLNGCEKLVCPVDIINYIIQPGALTVFLIWAWLLMQAEAF
jgi:hypothetical protein